MARVRKSAKQPSKIDLVFDDLEHTVERVERLLTKLIISFALIALLVFEVYLVGKLLSNRH